MVDYKGSCDCGQVNYSIADKPIFTQACHCKDCKKSTGSSFVIHSTVHEDDLTINGKVDSAELSTGSGTGRRVFFCTNCGTYLYCKYKIVESQRIVAIRSKTLNDSDKFPPQAHIFLKDKDPWVNLTDTKNCFDMMYDREKIWPEQSIKKLEEKNNQ